MHTVTIDTHQVYSILAARGYTKEQAEGFVEAIKELNLDQLATKHDLNEVEKRVGLNIDSVVERAKNDIMKWMFGGFITTLLAIMGIFLKLS